MKKNSPLKEKLNFEKVTGTKKQIKELYILLEKRRYSISHRHMPTMQEHTRFVVNNPYRVWYLIKYEESYIGSIYILEDNCISISALKYNEEIVIGSLNYLIQKYQPLAAVKSLRPPHYHINVSPDNKELISILEHNNAVKIQTTYLLNKFEFDN